MNWYAAKKKTGKRWQAYELNYEPKAKRGYEVKGPYDNIVECLMDVNKPLSDPGKCNGL